LERFLGLRHVVVAPSRIRSYPSGRRPFASSRAHSRGCRQRVCRGDRSILSAAYTTELASIVIEHRSTGRQLYIKYADDRQIYGVCRATSRHLHALSAISITYSPASIQFRVEPASIGLGCISRLYSQNETKRHHVVNAKM
jgi:hypothetical protein